MSFKSSCGSVATVRVQAVSMADGGEVFELFKVLKRSPNRLRLRSAASSLAGLLLCLSAGCTDLETGWPLPTPGGQGGTIDPGAGGSAAPVPTSLTSAAGPYQTSGEISLEDGSCLIFPDDPQAAPPYAAVVIAEGFLETGGCGTGSPNVGGWGALYASWGIVTLIVQQGAFDAVEPRAVALEGGLETLKAANQNPGSPLYGLLSGRYGTQGFSMGGGGASIAAQRNPDLLSNVELMPFQPATTGINVPTLVIMGAQDTVAGAQGAGSYQGISVGVPKMQVTVAAAHEGGPSAGGGDSGAAALAFQKVYLEGDERWKSLLLTVDYDATNIE